LNGSDLFVLYNLIALRTFVWLILSLTAGMKWGRMLHWSGEGLLTISVLLAAKGISDVRRQWAQQPGIRGSMVKRTKRVTDKCAELFWLCKNRFVERLPGLARLLRLRVHRTAELSSEWVLVPRRHHLRSPP
jgi:hypothetical protein